MLRLDKGSPEQQAVEAGEIDAIIDYSSHNVILFPAARRALREVAGRTFVADPESVANSLLAALPVTEYRRLLAGLVPVTLRFGAVLYQPGETIRHVYFPIDCAVSLLTPADDGRAMEAALVGYEGMVGIPLVLGVDISSVRARVQATGIAMRIETEHFHKVFLQCPSLQRVLYRYAHTKLTLARQTGACNSFHAAEARLARCFLLTSDRVRSEQFFLTQAFLAETLGVRRVTITEAAGRLQHRTLISYSRGKIRILDRRGLEAAACPCYSKNSELLREVM
ncbi:MAG TPA: Crp/Fnr family transcriptional regulator [Steroidobacteraceae bacterium]|nr:Crp/Fnr family transcriptional regulator [Steroidobacteraceae bacterium]